MKFNCAALETGKKVSFSFCFEMSTNIFYLSQQGTYIVFILQCRVSTKFLNLHTKRQKQK